MFTILLLAAGSSSRMRGRDKLMEKVDGQPLICTMAHRALQACRTVVVALPPNADTRFDALNTLDVTTCVVQDAAKGMAFSLRAGVAALPKNASAVMILPADMPELDALDLETMIAAWRASPSDAILRGTSTKGRPGHPVIFPKTDFAALQEITGDQGARDVLKANATRVVLVPLPDQHALTDLDTPEEWQAWRGSQG